MMAYRYEWTPYVPVAKRRADAARQAGKLEKKGRKLRPVQCSSRNMAASFWGLAWCKNLEVYADWANRLPRGRSYARNGSILDLQIDKGKITALVSGSSLYEIEIELEPLNKERWRAIRRDCSRQVRSLLDLMRGQLPDDVLARLTDPTQGMFPSPKELKPSCSCPDYAVICKHVAATLYGVGHLLDSEPALFFKMRGVEQAELVSEAMANQTAGDAIGLNRQSDLADEDLGALFGIDLSTTSAGAASAGRPRRAKSRGRMPKSGPRPAAHRNPAAKSKPAKADGSTTREKRAATKRAKAGPKSAVPVKARTAPPSQPLPASGKAAVRKRRAGTVRPLTNQPDTKGAKGAKGAKTKSSAKSRAASRKRGKLR